uniref:R13L1/DRL21-like LRR repeat region domain-containing protein n=1 Tax=Chenopodium quinoa TaxID=63459 RepID=A0A803MI60_CHEQI
MRKLACLRRLEIDGCEKVTFMPTGFEYLTSLRILSRYVVGRPRFQSSNGFKSLGNLNRLQGKLMIELSEDWTAAVNDAAKSNLSSKTRLTELEIKWGPARRTSKTDSHKHQTMLDGLQPPPNLKMLHIEGYKGPDFQCGQKPTLWPQHFLDSSLSALTANSDNQSSAPESQFFPALEELTLHSFYCLERWYDNETLVSSLSFDCLKKLNLWSCPKLESMPLFPDVEVLDLQNINKKLLEVPNVTTLPSSSSSKATNLVPRGHPQNLPLLETLHVKGCPSLKTLALGKNSDKLKKLVVERLDTLSSLVEVLKQLTSLEELEISSCKRSRPFRWMPKSLWCVSFVLCAMGISLKSLSFNSKGTTTARDSPCRSGNHRDTQSYMHFSIYSNSLKNAALKLSTKAGNPKLSTKAGNPKFQAEH